MNVFFKIITPLLSIKLENMGEIHNYEHPEDYDLSPEVELWLNDSKLITLSFEEACELDLMDYNLFERGLEYCDEVDCRFEAWELAAENFACHNNEDGIRDMILGSNQSIQDLGRSLLNHFDFQSYWESDARHDYTATDNFIFYSY